MIEKIKEAQKLFKYKDGKEYQNIRNFVSRLIKENEKLKNELKNAKNASLF